MNITNCRALVTGGGSGLGRYVLEALAGAGADIAITYNSSRERAEDAAKLVQAAGRTAHCVELDLTDENSVNAGVEAAVEQLGGLDILVNNAADTGAANWPFEEFTVEKWDSLMAINMRGPFLMARAVAPHLQASGRGRIVNVGSVVGLAPSVSAYSFVVSKAGVIPLTRYLAAALAPDILVNCVAPGLMEGTLMSGGASEEHLQQWRDKSVLGRTTSHADVAAQIVRFCESDSITGQTLVIDGGIHFH
jgi:3-oxoacyl-[acyl-carrier protein] reductase